MDHSIVIANTGAAPANAGTNRFFSSAVLERYWRELLRRKWLVGAIIAGCVALALVITLLMTPVYTATARIEISRTGANVTNVESLEAEDAGKSLEFYQTQYSLLESQSLATRVARALNLMNDRTFIEAFGLEQDNASSGDAARASADRLKAVVGILKENVSIDPIRGSSLIDVAFTSPDPALSAKIANAWTEQFIQSSLDRRFASSNDARRFLEQQLATLRERLERSESDLVNYAANKRIIALSTTEASDGSTRTERTLAAADLEALNSQLAEAIGSRIQAESAYRATGGGASDSMIANSAINGLRQQRAIAAAEYARLLTQFEPGYPTALALKSQIDALDQAVAREEARVRSNLRTNFSEAQQRERELSGRVEALKGDLISQRRDSIQYAIFQREVDTNRELYDALLQRYKEIGVAGVGSNNIAIVDQAERPGGPSSPSLVLNILLALIAGSLISAGVVVAYEYIDQSLRDPQDVDKVLGVPLLGSIPRVRDDDIAKRVGDPKSEVSEAYLSVKTSLSFLTDHGVPRAFMLTSTAPNEGKSISSIALAQILGRSGNRVVLIDADMRNPSILKLLGMPASEGLSNYLAGHDDFEGLVAPAPFENVVVMGAGPSPPNAAELLSSNRMRHLVKSLQGQFDYVMVDSPPILGLADVPLISQAVEGVIVTIEANRHKMRAIENSLKRLRAANAHILGAIVTKVDERNSAYGYGYGYGYGYRYEGSEEAVPRAG